MRTGWKLASKDTIMSIPTILRPVSLFRQAGETDDAYSLRLSSALRAAPAGSQAYADAAYALALAHPDWPGSAEYRRIYEGSPFVRRA
jgi:hypothetical protein